MKSMLGDPGSELYPGREKEKKKKCNAQVIIEGMSKQK